MAHKFAHHISLDPAGAPLAKGPTATKDPPIFRISVWVTQEKSKAAARGSKDFGNNPKAKWECATTLMENSPRFQKGPALGMAIALVKKGNGKEYFGWWDDDVVIV
jgi:hypothetical protein